MRISGVQADTAAYNTLINACAGRLLCFDKFSYFIIIYSMCLAAAGDLDRALGAGRYNLFATVRLLLLVIYSVYCISRDSACDAGGRCGS